LRSFAPHRSGFGFFKDIVSASLDFLLPQGGLTWQASFPKLPYFSFSFTSF